MTLQEAARLLILGLDRDVLNIEMLARRTGVSRNRLLPFLRGEELRDPGAIDRLTRYVWQRLNAHVLLSPEDGVDAR